MLSSRTRVSATDGFIMRKGKLSAGHQLETLWYTTGEPLILIPALVRLLKPITDLPKVRCNSGLQL